MKRIVASSTQIAPKAAVSNRKNRPAQPFFLQNPFRGATKNPKAQKKIHIFSLTQTSPNVPRLFQTQPADTINAKQKKQPKTSLSLQHFFSCCSTTAKNWPARNKISSTVVCFCQVNTKNTMSNATINLSPSEALHRWMTKKQTLGACLWWRPDSFFAQFNA